MLALTQELDLIVVMPDGGSGTEAGWYSDWKDGSRHWETFHTKVLIPFVDRKFRTLGSKHRAVALDGAYLFSDFCKGRLAALRLGRDGKVSEHRQFRFDVAQVSSFGQDADGELYLLNLTKGAIYRIDPA